MKKSRSGPSSCFALSRSLTPAALLLAAMSASSSLHAQATWVGDSSNDWNTAANWSSDPSNPSGNFTINGAGLTPVLSTNSAFSPVDVIVGVAATGRFDHTGGTLSTGTGNWFIVGRNASGNGTYNLADTATTGGALTGFGTGTGSLNVGGSSTTSGRLIIADTSSSVGTVNMNTTGTMKLEDDSIGLLMGNGGTSNGTFKLDAGTLQINSVATTGIAILVGTNGGDGNFSMSGGTVNATGGLWVGDNNAGSQGTFAVSGGTVNVTASGTYSGSQAGQVYIGRGLGQGTFTVSNTAAVTVTGATNIGYSNTATAGTTGTLTVSGGTFTNTGELRVGVGQSGNGVTARADGTFNVSGGTANIGGALVLARGNDSGDLVTGTATVSGGTLNVENDLVVAFAGNNNLGQMTISGGVVNVATTTERWMIVNQWDTSRGQLTVSGGTLNLNANTDLRFSTGNSTGASSVTLNSGAITSYSGNGTGSSTTGVVDLNRAGAAVNNTFNLNGGTLTISEVMTTNNTGTVVFNFNGGTLKAANSTGAVIGPITVGNFLDLGGATQTAVVKSGGAFIDSNGFNVTIPQPLLDGTGGGGLTKSGLGTLTLSGASTYTGPTVVTAGTLSLASAGSLASTSFSIGNGATFDTSAKASFDLSGVATTIGLDASTGGFFNAGSGALTVGNSLTLNFSTASLVVGTTYNLFDFGSRTGDFSSVNLTGSISSSLARSGDLWTGTGGSFGFAFDESNGVLTVVPEPSTCAALFGALALGASAVRRRRRG